MPTIPSPDWALITSALDDDLYKASMQAAVIRLYDEIDARYAFFNRGKTKFPPGFASALQSQIDRLKFLALTVNEIEWLRTCPSLSWLPRAYIDFLIGFRYSYDKLFLRQSDDGELEIEIEGPWYRVIRWEVPLMALISELYFRMTGQKADVDLFVVRLQKKARLFEAEGCNVTDFGTRRRHSYNIHDNAVRYLVEHCKTFMGTSNLHFAHKYRTRPIGTHAHEWFMFHAAMHGVTSANRTGCEAWMKMYGGRLGIVLPDTFTTDVFLRDFNLLMARQFDGVRHNSGDPVPWGYKMIRHYESLGIDPTTKLVIFSDALDAAKAVALQREFAGKIRIAFGIGTNLTNDVGVKPLNMVIKATAFRIHGTWVPVSKLSDDTGKATGEVAELYRQVLRI